MTAVRDRSSDVENPGELLPEGARENIRVLAVDDDASTLENCETVLRGAGYEVDTTKKGQEALEELRRGRVQILLIDKRMPEMSGLEVLEAMQECSPSTVAVMMTGYASAASGVQALKAGAWDYLPKPFTATQLQVLVDRAAHRVLQTTRDTSSNTTGEGVLHEDPTILGESEAFRRVLDRARRVARTDAAVLLTGESGTGKELIAQFIHSQSQRTKKELVPVNCAALPDELLESEMFGHREGAFTGAVRDKRGLLEVADGGTLFLDELCEMPIQLQPKLLRVLQNGVVRRLGSETTDAVVDVRVISATNRDPQEAMEEEQLREDLFFRIGVFPIHLPPLRERPEDIPVLVHHFLSEMWQRCSPQGQNLPEITSAAMDRLMSYSWPGNVRELRNVIQQLLVLREPDGPITIDEFSMLRSARPESENGWARPLVMKQDLEQPYHSAKDAVISRFEREYLSGIVNRANGNISEAARRAEIDRTTLYRLMEKHELSKDDLCS